MIILTDSLIKWNIKILSILLSLNAILIFFATTGYAYEVLAKIFSITLTLGILLYVALRCFDISIARMVYSDLFVEIVRMLGMLLVAGILLFISFKNLEIGEKGMIRGITTIIFIFSLKKSIKNIQDLKDAIAKQNLETQVVYVTHKKEGYGLTYEGRALHNGNYLRYISRFYPSWECKRYNLQHMKKGCMYEIHLTERNQYPVKYTELDIAPDLDLGLSNQLS